MNSDTRPLSPSSLLEAEFRVADTNSVHTVNSNSTNLQLDFDPIETFIEPSINYLNITQQPTSIINTPVSIGTVLKCRILRNKDIFPIYDFYIERQDTSTSYLMSSRKRLNAPSCYHISNQRDGIDSEPCAIVNSNILGTRFTVLQDSCEIASICYEPNVLGIKGPRKMTVEIPTVDSDSERITLFNKTPQWNEENQSFVLNFNGRVGLASVKNFQIVGDEDLEYIILQFGRVSKDLFSIDISYPMTPLQAFGIILSSFDFKLACE